MGVRFAALLAGRMPNTMPMSMENRHAPRYRPPGHAGRRKIRYQRGHAISEPEAQDHADDAADHGENHCLDQELQQYETARRAQCLGDADLARTLSH